MTTIPEAKCTSEAAATITPTPHTGRGNCDWKDESIAGKWRDDEWESPTSSSSTCWRSEFNTRKVSDQEFFYMTALVLENKNHFDLQATKWRNSLKRISSRRRRRVKCLQHKHVFQRCVDAHTVHTWLASRIRSTVLCAAFCLY